MDILCQLWFHQILSTVYSGIISLIYTSLESAVSWKGTALKTVGPTLLAEKPVYT